MPPTGVILVRTPVERGWLLRMRVSKQEVGGRKQHVEQTKNREGPPSQLPYTHHSMYGAPSSVEIFLLVGLDGAVGGRVGHAGEHESVAHLVVIQEGLIGLVDGSCGHLSGAAGAGSGAARVGQVDSGFLWLFHGAFVVSSVLDPRVRSSSFVGPRHMGSSVPVLSCIGCVSYEGFVRVCFLPPPVRLRRPHVHVCRIVRGSARTSAASKM